MAEMQQDHFTVELLPALADSSRAVCLQACPHCPAGVTEDEYENTSIQAYNEIQMAAFLKIQEYCKRYGIDFAVLLSGITRVKLAQSLAPFPFIKQPFYIGVGLGVLPNDPKAVDKIAEETMARLSVLFADYLNEEKNLQFAFSMMPELSGVMIKNPEVVGRLVRFLVRMLLDDSFKIAIDSLSFQCDFNALSPEDFSILERMAGVLMKLGDFMTLAETALPMNKVRRSVTDTYSVDGMVGVKAEYDLKDLLVRFSGRHMRKDKGKQTAKQMLSTKPGNQSFALNPDHVWVEHSTWNVPDKSLRIPYPKFMEIFDTALAEEKRPIELLVEHIESVRK